MSIWVLLASWVCFCYCGKDTSTEAVIMVGRPDYAVLAQEVEALGAKEMPRFHGEALEEVDILFKNFQLGLEEVLTFSRLVNGGEIHALTGCMVSARDAISNLRHYEIDEATIKRFEEIHSELNAWAGELRARGHFPSGPASPPL